MVKFLGFDQVRPREVAELERPLNFMGPGFSVSSDGRWILFLLQQEESDLMVARGFR